eukprot:6461519-Amphidinium_carterae.1
MTRIAAESVDNVMREAMKQLVTVAEMSEAHIALVLKDAATKLQFLAGVDEITKRTVKFKYRGIEIEHCCACPLDQIEYSVRVWLRAKGASAECSVPEKLLAKANRVRGHVKTLLSKQAEEDQDGDMQASGMVRICALSCSGDLQIAREAASEVLTFMVGNAGAELLKRQWKSRTIDGAVATHDIEGAMQ